MFPHKSYIILVLPNVRFSFLIFDFTNVVGIRVPLFFLNGLNPSSFSTTLLMDLYSVSGSTRGFLTRST